MKNFMRCTALLLTAAMTMGMLSGCIADAPSKLDGGTSAPQELTKVTVSEVTHSVFYAPQYVAMNLGFFAEEGLEVELSVGQGADKVMAAVLSGSVDIGLAGPEAAIYVYNEGREDHSQIFAQLTQRDGSFLVGREPADTFSWSDLAGSHLLPGRKGGVPYMTLEHVVREKGLTPNQDVEFDDSIQFSLMAGAFTAGTGDYVTLFEPTASMMEQEGKGYILASIGEESGEIPYTAYFASKSFLRDRADIVQAFTNAVYKGQKWVQEHSAQEIAQQMAPYFADTDTALLTTVVERYKGIDAWSHTPLMGKEGFERLQEIMTEAGELTEKADYDALVNNSFAQQAVDTLQ